MIKLAYIYQTNDFLAGFYRWQKLVGRGILSYHRIFAICIGYVFFSFQMQQYRIIKKIKSLRDFSLLLHIFLTFSN